MYARLAHVLASQGGLITRAQALDSGLPPSRLQQLVDQEQLVYMRRGVYADAEVHAGLDEFVGLPKLRARAVLLTKHCSWVASHDSSALELGMPLINPRTSLVHLTRPGYGAAWTRAGVAHHYGRFAPGQLQISSDGVRHLCIARTAVDLAREHGELAGLVACDWALRHGVPRTALMEAYLPMSHWPGVIDVRAAVERADPRAESAAETLGRDLVQELGVGEADPQFPLLVDGRLVWSDLRIGNHLFEVQGKIKYLPVEDGGLATRSPTEVIWAEKKRSRLIRAERLGVSEILFEDFWGERRAAALLRLRAEYDVSEQRFGAELHPHLAVQAAELRARFGRRDRAS